MVEQCCFWGAHPLLIHIILFRTLPFSGKQRRLRMIIYAANWAWINQSTNQFNWLVDYRVSNSTVSVANVENAQHSTRLLAQTTLRNMLGTKNLAEILSDRETISNIMQVWVASWRVGKLAKQAYTFACRITLMRRLLTGVSKLSG